jgi:hypothetical protein
LNTGGRAVSTGMAAFPRYLATALPTGNGGNRGNNADVKTIFKRGKIKWRIYKFVFISEACAIRGGILITYGSARRAAAALNDLLL